MRSRAEQPQEAPNEFSFPSLSGINRGNQTESEDDSDNESMDINSNSRAHNSTARDIDSARRAWNGPPNNSYL